MSVSTSLRRSAACTAVLGAVTAAMVGLAAPGNADVLPGGSFLGPNPIYVVTPPTTATYPTFHATSFIAWGNATRGVRSFG